MNVRVRTKILVQGQFLLELPPLLLFKFVNLVIELRKIKLNFGRQTHCAHRIARFLDNNTRNNAEQRGDERFRFFLVLLPLFFVGFCGAARCAPLCGAAVLNRFGTRPPNWVSPKIVVSRSCHAIRFRRIDSQNQAD